MSKSTYETNSNAPASGSSSAMGAGAADTSQEALSLGKFKPWGAAARAIDAKLGQTAQLVALQLARRTPPSGVILMTAPKLAAITKYTVATIYDALAELVASGLVTVRKTRTGNQYTWTREAYTYPGVTARSGNT